MALSFKILVTFLGGLPSFILFSWIIIKANNWRVAVASKGKSLSFGVETGICFLSGYFVMFQWMVITLIWVQGNFVSWHDAADTEFRWLATFSSIYFFAWAWWHYYYQRATEKIKVIKDLRILKKS